MKKIDGKKIVKKLKKVEKKRRKISFSLDAGLYETFMDICKKNKVVASHVLDELIKDFIESVE